MALLKIYIPASQFEEGGKFAAYADNKRGVQVQMASVLPTLNITSQPVFIDETQFQPYSNRAYRADLDAVRKGLIVVEKGGVVQTAENMTEIFRQFFQEL